MISCLKIHVLKKLFQHKLDPNLTECLWLQLNRICCPEFEYFKNFMFHSNTSSLCLLHGKPHYCSEKELQGRLDFIEK